MNPVLGVHGSYSPLGATYPGIYWSCLFLAVNCIPLKIDFSLVSQEFLAITKCTGLINHKKMKDGIAFFFFFLRVCYFSLQASRVLPCVKCSLRCEAYDRTRKV